MRFTSRDLDELLWEWAADTLKEIDSGYPSSYELNYRVDNGVIFIPDYFPKPKIHHLANEILALQRDQRNSIIARYLFCMNVCDIAKAEHCHPATIYRNLSKARRYLLDSMRKFVYTFRRL